MAGWQTYRCPSAVFIVSNSGSERNGSSNWFATSSTDSIIIDSRNRQAPCTHVSKMALPRVFEERTLTAVFEMPKGRIRSHTTINPANRIFKPSMCG